MTKRVPVPEGKTLFYRKADAPASRPTPAPAAAPTPAPAPTQSDDAEDELLEEPGRGQTRQTAIFLEERHLDWLDDKCREARRNGGRAVRKAAIIRALLDVALGSPIDLTSLRREDDIIVRVRRGLAATRE
ncbi:MAG: hypothetical protein HY329_12440 [Chloroflexi bacterium]|nr:hypothetical protein [Chloroflexota bacterium]